MLTNAEIKEIRSLGEKKFRDSLSLFVVEGEKMVQEALMSRFEVVKVIRREEVGDAVMAKISSMSTPPPVIAVVRKSAPAALTLDRGLYLGLDSVRDPGNMGTIIRLAEWFGIGTVFTSPDCVEVWNPKVIQASMGSIFRVRTVTADIADMCRRFRAADMPVYGTFLDGTDIYSQMLSDEGLIVMGNESNGVSPGVEALVTSKLYIPSYGNSRAESLNVAVATAVTLAEFRRR